MKKERHKNNRCKYQKYWASSWTVGKDTTQGNVRKHQLARNFLHIDSELITDHINVYRKNNKTITTNNVNSNIQGELSSPQMINTNTSAPIAKKDRNKYIFPVHQTTVSCHYRTASLLCKLASVESSIWSR